MKQKAKHIFEILLEFPSMLFERHLEKRNLIGVWGYVLFLYLIGLGFWGVFFNWGKSPLNVEDWGVISLPRYEAVRDAIHYQMLPLHVDCDTCLHKLTDRFLVLPDVITTPQMLIMSIIDVDTFGIFDLLLHYTIATIGLLILRQHLKLSLIAYSFLFFLFNFNGYIQSHYAVGHLSWAGYFLFPFYFLLILQLFDQTPSWKWVAGISSLSFYIILAGSQHHFTWLMLFLLFLGISHYTSFKWILTAIFFSGFLSAIRLLPPVLGFNEFSDIRFFTGYDTLLDFLSALTVLREPSFYKPTTIQGFILGYWEFDYFIGIVGTIFVIYFGVINWVNSNGRFKKYIPLIIPALLILILSQGQIYKYTLYNIQIFSSERVSSRMISVPITLFMIMGVAQFQEFLETKKSTITRWVTIGGLIILGNELHTHIVAWNAKRLGDFLGIRKLQFPGNSIINHPDPQYIMVLSIGLTLTLLSAAVLVFLVRREKHKNNQS